MKQIFTFCTVFLFLIISNPGLAAINNTYECYFSDKQGSFKHPSGGKPPAVKEENMRNVPDNLEVLKRCHRIERKASGRFIKDNYIEYPKTTTTRQIINIETAIAKIWDRFDANYDNVSEVFKMRMEAFYTSSGASFFKIVPGANNFMVLKPGPRPPGPGTDPILKSVDYPELHINAGLLDKTVLTNSSGYFLGYLGTDGACHALTLQRALAHEMYHRISYHLYDESTNDVATNGAPTPASELETVADINILFPEQVPRAGYDETLLSCG